MFDLVLPMQEVYEMTSYFNGTERGLLYNKQIVTSPGDVRDMNWFRMQVANGLGQGTQYAATYLSGNAKHNLRSVERSNRELDTGELCDLVQSKCSCSPQPACLDQSPDQWACTN